MARGGTGAAAGLFGWGARMGVRGSVWALTRPWALAKLGGKEMIGAGAFGVSYWAGLVVWFAFGLLALYAAGWAARWGWLTPVQWALAASGILCWASLLVYLRTRAVRNNARARMMMRRMFESTQRTEAKVVEVEQAVSDASRRGPGAFDPLRWPGTSTERMTAQLRAAQAAQARTMTGGPVTAGPEPVFPVPRVLRRFGQGARRGWRNGGPR